MELTVDQALQQGVAAYREGKLQDAEQLYRAILQAQPNHPDANHNLGVLAAAVGKPLEAIPFFKLALETNPTIEQFWLSYIDTLISVERFDEAKRVLFEGDKSVVSLEKLDVLKQRLQGGVPNDMTKTEKGQTLTKKRAKLAEKKKKKAQGALFNSAPAQHQITHLVEHYQAGRFEEAKAPATSLTQQFPNHPFGYKVLGSVLKQMGRVGESLAPKQKAAELSPQDPEAHSNLGNTLQELGRLDEAEASCRQAITLKPDYAEAHNNLGITLHELERLDEAEASYKQAITFKPGYAEAHYNFGNTLKKLGRLDEAEAGYRHAIALKPDYAKAYNNLGNTLKELGRFVESEASYKQAIALEPDYVTAHLNLCSLQEATNEIDKLLIVLEEARSKTKNMTADFRYYETLAFFRKERFAEADALITRIPEGEVSEERKASYFKLKGDLRHLSQNYDAAFLCFENSNRTVKASSEYQRLKVAADRYFELQRDMARELEQLAMGGSYSNRLSSDGRQPAFLVGFPRSGTTLLDTILRTHSKIAVVEEQAMVARAHSALGDLENVSAIEAIDQNDLDIATDAYLEELERHTSWPEESLVIDKLPLNLFNTPLINRIFPKAKFILAVRHPLDCILSCWMQTFKLNLSMANMVDLDRIVDFYCVAMAIFQLSQRRYGLNVHRVRYEDLIDNLKGEATSSLSFLDLEWEADLENYQATALNRKKIDTPSRSQVIKPIYRSASYRWKHYEKHLEKFNSQLAPWVEEFGYEQ
jgi:tetratricopeptide (TPR) repeat protein